MKWNFIFLILFDKIAHDRTKYILIYENQKWKDVFCGIADMHYIASHFGDANANQIYGKTKTKLIVIV